MPEKIDSNEIKAAFGSLCETIAALRHPVTGCPWDLEQTHGTLRKYMIEEAYEAVDVMEPVNYQKLREELGDVLLQVVLNAQLAKDAGQFTIVDVVRDLDAKMKRRHPHVFGDQNNPNAKSSREKSDIKTKWEEVKQQEKSQSGDAVAKGIFDQLKAGNINPASRMAVAIGKVAKSISFDWNNSEDVFAQLESEIAELKQELNTNSSKSNIVAELGDVYFCLSQLSRHLDIDPEVCAVDGNKKFLSRFRTLENIAEKKGLDVKTAGTAQLEELWKEAKKIEKSNQKNR